MAVKYHQISLKDIFSDCRDMFIDDTPSFFQLLEEHFDLSEFIPSVFYNAFYQHLGRKGIIPYRLPFRPHPPEDLLYPYRFPSYSSAPYL